MAARSAASAASISASRAARSAASAARRCGRGEKTKFAVAEIFDQSEVKKTARQTAGGLGII